MSAKQIATHHIFRKKLVARLTRSPELMNSNDSALLVVDLQAKLMPLIPNQERILWNTRRIIDGANILGVPIAATEQYPQGLGGTSEVIRPLLQEPHEKLAFSCAECGEIFTSWKEDGRQKVLLVGIEAHVCVQQTALDLLGNGFAVYLATDAIGARHSVDYETALRRMESSGATITTTESVLFEWCDIAGTDSFKQISKLIQESAPV